MKFCDASPENPAWCTVGIEGAVESGLVLVTARILSFPVLCNSAAIDKPAGELRLGAVQTALTGLLPDILALMTTAYPHIKIHIDRDSSTEMYRKVLSGDLDAAILSHPPFAIPKTCDWRDLREEPFVLLTRAPAPRRRAHDILATEPFIRLDRGLHAGRLIDTYLRKTGIRPKE